MSTETLVLTERDILLFAAKDRKKMLRRVGVLPVHSTVVVAMGLAESAPLYAHGVEPSPEDRQRSVLLPVPHVERWMQFYHDYAHSDEEPPLYCGQTVLRYVVGIDETVTPEENSPCAYGSLSVSLVPGCGYRLMDEHGPSGPSVYCISRGNRVLSPLYYGGPLIVGQCAELLSGPDAQFAQILPPSQ